MAERIVIHAGPHKTGTTALQGMFARNRNRLKQFGISYPETGLVGSAHQDVARACWEADSPLLVNLTGEMKYLDTVLISSELISALEPQGMERLSSACCATNIEIIYVLRRLTKLLASHWKEMIKHGQSFDFETYLKLAKDDVPSRYFSPPMPMQQLDRISAAFGTDCLRLMIYDARILEPQHYGLNFVDDVFGIGQDADVFRSDRMNLTPQDWKVELCRLMNGLAHGRLAYPERIELRNRLYAYLDTTIPDWISDFIAVFDACEPVILSDQVPFILDAQTKVIETYGQYLIDPPECYTAPSQTAVRNISKDALPPELWIAVHHLFEEII